MEGIIVNFRGSEKHKSPNYMVIKVDGIESKEKAQSLVNKAVSWKTPAGNEIKGRVSKVHGNKGAVRVKFERGMPGQAIGCKVDIA